MSAQMGSWQHHADRVIQHVMSVGTDPSLSLVHQSWARCIHDYGLDPGQPRPARIVTSDVLRAHQEAIDELLNVARAGVTQLHQEVAGLGYVVLLSDAQGVTVAFQGDQSRDAQLHQAGLYLGADWREAYAGTCAVGTCIHEQRALTCHHHDHFDSSHIHLTCTAAPIFDPFGQLMAVLDISALGAPNDRHSQNFALHLTQLYARLIENAYFWRRYQHHIIVQAGESRELVQVAGQYLWALDGEGQVLAANTPARALWRGQVEAGVATEGSLTRLFDCSWPEMLALMGHSPLDIRAMHLLDGQLLFARMIMPPRPQHRPEVFVEGASSEPEFGAVSETPLPLLDALAGDDPAMRKTLSLARRLCRRPVNLLILGETGTGKELLARRIHQSGDDPEAPFVAVNCAAIPETLIESELFGYEAGAFTGARAKGAAGLIQQADGGTLFLDEIGDMPLALQTRLLRFLAEGEVMPLGARRPREVKCRVIAATHCDLESAIAEGRFRADLYYRLNGAELILPPLRQRSDKAYVIQCALRQVCDMRGRTTLHLRADAMSVLLAYEWPGNIRQLIHALAFAEAMVEGHEVTAFDLPEAYRSGTHSSVARMSPSLDVPHLLDRPPVFADRAACIDRFSGMDRSTSPEGLSIERLPDEGERLRHAMMRCGGNISQVARQLQVSRPTVYRRLKKYGLMSSDVRPLGVGGSG